MVELVSEVGSDRVCLITIVKVRLTLTLQRLEAHRAIAKKKEDKKFQKGSLLRWGIFCRCTR